MPTRPPQQCAHPGCRLPTPGRYCDKHKPEPRESINPQTAYERTRQSGKSKRSKAHKKNKKEKSLYGYKWQQGSTAFRKANPFCAKCGSIFNTVVDHIRPHRGDKKLFWDRSNWQVLCQTCHGQKSSRERIYFNKTLYDYETKG